MVRAAEIGTEGNLNDPDSWEEPEVFKGFVDIALEFRTSTDVVEVGEVRLNLVRKPAFPGAYGFGRWTQGGTRGEVFIVDQFGDPTDELGYTPFVLDGAQRKLYDLKGSFRQAIRYRNYDHNNRLVPRTVVFESAGVVNLVGDVRVGGSPDDALRGLLTIAGQSAPMGGVLVKGGGFYMTNKKEAQGLSLKRSNDIAIRYLRFRPYGEGEDNSADDAVRIDGSSDIILDHVSASWGRDGTIDIGGSSSGANDNPDQVVTVQWCNVTETLRPHSKASLVRGKWGSRYTMHHNLYTNHDERMPEIGHVFDAVSQGDYNEGGGVLVDVRNNVFHNWGGKECSRTAETAVAAQIRFNLINNRWTPGPDADLDWCFREKNGNSRGFFAGNLFFNAPWPQLSGTSFPHWIEDLPTGRSLGGDYFQSAQFRCDYVKTDQNWEESVIEKSGDHRLRDAIDRRAAECVSSGNGRITADVILMRDFAITELGHGTADYTAAGWPEIPLATWSSSYDVDFDGMRDTWEADYLSEGETIDSFEPWGDRDGDGWTNLEEFLNKTKADVGEDPMDVNAESHVEGSL